MRPLLAAAVLAGLAWWLLRPRPRKRRPVAASDPYADAWTHLRTFRTPGGVATAVYEVKRCAINRHGQPIWRTLFAWRCDCAANDDGYVFRPAATRDAIHHHEGHARGAA